MITDYWLNEVAKSISGESFLTPNYLAVATGAITSIDAATTSLIDEIGSRLAVTKVRGGNQVTLNTLRSSGAVVNTISGDNLTAIGLFAVPTSGTLMQGNTVTGLLHTTNFDIDFTFVLNVERV